MYKIRVILDTQEDVIRTILVDNDINLEALHFTIVKSFGLSGTEMASFYRTDNEWNQGQEIPLFNMSEVGEGISMQNSFLGKIMPNINDKLIYVYDFFNMWAFYVEVIDILDNANNELPKTILSVGKLPKEAPRKKILVEGFRDEQDDKPKDEFDSLNGMDFDSY